MSAVPPLPPGVEGYRLGLGRPERVAAENAYWDRRAAREDVSTPLGGPLPAGVCGYSTGLPARRSGDVPSGHG